MRKGLGIYLFTFRKELGIYLLTFRKGLGIYLKRFEYKNAVTRDLWEALAEATNHTKDVEVRREGVNNTYFFADMSGNLRLLPTLVKKKPTFNT